jgi:hypothetical protein
VTDRIEQQVRSAFPEGVIARVQMLQYGDDPEVEPGQTAMRVFNGVVVKTGKTSSCDNPPNCTLTYSHVSWLCTANPGHSPRSYVFCDGYYRAEGHFSIHPTNNYSWPSPAPKGCTITQDSEVLTCTLYTPSKHIPETI